MSPNRCLWAVLGCAVGWDLRDTPIPVIPEMHAGVLVAGMLDLTLMTGQGMIGSQRTLYDSGDLSLLFTAPMPERSVLLAKLLGIAGSIALTYATLLPVVVPVAILGHPYLFGLVAVLATARRLRHRASKRLFHAGLTRSVFAKEWRLLARDPALAFQIVLRLVYLAPLLLGLLSGRHTVPVPPALAFASVLIQRQLVGSFAWRTVSAEDSPDLLAVAPVGKDEIDTAKLLASFAMAEPFALILPIAIATTSPVGAIVVTLVTWP